MSQRGALEFLSVSARIVMVVSALLLLLTNYRSDTPGCQLCVEETFNKKSHTINTTYSWFYYNIWSNFNVLTVHLISAWNLGKNCDCF